MVKLPRMLIGCSAFNSHDETDTDVVALEFFCY